MILNLTTTPSTKEQLDVGVVDLTGDKLKELISLLNCTDADAEKGIAYIKAVAIVRLAIETGAKNAMIDRHCWLFRALADELRFNRISPLIANYYSGDGGGLVFSGFTDLTLRELTFVSYSDLLKKQS